MGTAKSAKNPNQKTIRQTQANGEVVEVLYQKMGDRWFAFSLIDDEVFVGSITQEVIDGVGDPTGPNLKPSPNA